MQVRMTQTKVAWVRDPGVPAGQPADGSFTCPCGHVTGGRAYGGPAWVCGGCQASYDGRGWLIRRN